jgi:cytochrome d ubiquinol oxidase subunit I
MDEMTVLLSRFQFALTAMYHFLFVPLTIGLSVLIAIQETLYVITQNEIWKKSVKFWGSLFGINFAMGVATGITLEFQFGTNWSYFSHYIGDVFGSILAIEGLMAFFLEATFIGLFFFGWKRLTQKQHLGVTWFLSLATNLSALWILIANAWMQNPVGAKFNPNTLRMELTSFSEIFFNPVAQCKVLHTVSASYVTGSLFVFAISAFFALKKRHLEIAKRSMTIAAIFGFFSSLLIVFIGDESGYVASKHQKLKIAGIESIWDTEIPPASFTVFGWPDSKNRTTHYELKIPYILGIIATRSLNQKVEGINELLDQAKPKIYSGIRAYEALEKIKTNPKDKISWDLFEKDQKNLGYALLLKRFHKTVSNPTPEHLQKTCESLIPNVFWLFWAFRIMVFCGFLFIAFFSFAFYLSIKRRLLNHRWFLRSSLVILPLPWVASELGWFVAENGRQPWAINEILPTSFASSSISPSSVWVTLFFFFLFYTILLILDIYLMIKQIKKGPEEVLSKKES